MECSEQRRRWLRPVGGLALAVGLAIGAVAPAVAQDQEPADAAVDLTGVPVALHDGSCANPVLEPEFEIGQLEPEPYSEVVDDFVTDALDEDVPADVRTPLLAPGLIDEDLDGDGVLDEDEDIDGDGVIDFGIDENEDGVLSEDELLDEAEAAILLVDFPTVWKAEEEVDATFEELFGADEDAAEEEEDDDALDDPGIVAIHESSEQFGNIVACGEMIAPFWEDESDVVVGIRPMNGSGVYGFAVFERDTGDVPIFGEDATGVTVYLFQNLGTIRSERLAEATPTP